MAVIDKLRMVVGFPRRMWDRRTHRWGDYLDRLALAAAFVFIFLTFQSIQDGRRTSLGAICAVTSAVVDAGRLTIQGGGQNMSPRLERNLERLGYPPPKVRAQRAKDAADLYRKTIALRVQKQTHVSGLIRHDGTFDCDKLVVAAHAK